MEYILPSLGYIVIGLITLVGLFITVGILMLACRVLEKPATLIRDNLRKIGGLRHVTTYIRSIVLIVFLLYFCWAVGYMIWNKGEIPKYKNAVSHQIDTKEKK